MIFNVICILKQYKIVFLHFILCLYHMSVGNISSLCIRDSSKNDSKLSKTGVVLKKSSITSFILSPLTFIFGQESFRRSISRCRYKIWKTNFLGEWLSPFFFAYNIGKPESILNYLLFFSIIKLR